MAKKTEQEGKPQGKAAPETKGSKGAGASKAKAKTAKPAEQEVARAAVPPRLREKYYKNVVPGLAKRFGYKNPNQMPRVSKVVVNMGLGQAVGNPKMIDAAVEEICQITGQKPVVEIGRAHV